ncbi:MAG: radical SAM protein [Gammaproteobacteria bacterium]|nr:radical SAM protein [Gammaproteobacteria bacterium]
MKKVLLLSPPYVKDYMRNARCDFVSNSGSQWYPIWLGYCGAFLEQQGYQVRFVDGPASGIDFAQTEQIFSDFRPDLLLIYSGQLSEESDCQLADRLLTLHPCEAIFVGPFFSINPEQTLGKSQRMRYGVTGEFEYPVLEFLRGDDPATIANFVVKGEEGAVARVAERPYLDGQALDAFPFVSDFFQRHLDLRWYRTPSEKFPYIDMMSGRGCVWGQCTYCLWVFSFIKGHTYNLRSIENLVDEVAFIEKQMPQVKSLMIQDDTFPSGRAREFAEEKLRRNLKLPWSCYSRGNIDYEVLQLMKQSGCLNLHVGFESGNPEILKNIKKGVDRERMTRFAHDAKRAGVHLHGDFAIGFPGESAETIRQTIDWACEIRPDTAQFQLMIPFEGTPMYDELKAQGQLKNGAPDFPELNWQEMEAWAKQAYREFYISWPYAKEVAMHPYDLGVKKFGTYISAVPSLFWKRWNVR